MRRYLEFAVVVLVISVLALVLWKSIGRAGEELEEARMQADVSAIRIGLMEMVAQNQINGGSLPKSDNPIDWVAMPPGGYLGERDGVPEAESVWYFDRKTKELVYRFRDGHRARFRISRDARVESVRAVVAGVGLLRLEDMSK
jgi:hypothetical protein